MRVLVLRPREQAEDTAARLAERGHAAILAPVLAIAATASAPPAGPFDALLVTSRNAIPSLAAQRDRFAGLRVFAVGPRTGSALAEAGFADVEAASGDAASLAALVTARLPPRTRLLHAAGRDGRSEPRSALRAAGYDMTTWQVYAAEAASRLPEAAREALSAGSLDAVLHYSPRSAALAEQLVRAAALDLPFRALLHLCLSRSVAEAFRTAPPRLAVAREPSEARLLERLDEEARGAD